MPSIPTTCGPTPGTPSCSRWRRIPSAYHTVQIILRPMAAPDTTGALPGLRSAGSGNDRHHLPQAGAWQSTYFGVVDPRGPVRARWARPLPDAVHPRASTFAFGVNSGVLVNPPPDGGEGNTSFTVTLDPALPPGPFYVMASVDGPTMNAASTSLRRISRCRARSWTPPPQRQYQADLCRSPVLDRVSGPAEASNPDGTKTWQVAAGVSRENKPWLSINEFAPAQLVIIAGDTVTWTNQGPGAVAHTVTGFAATPDAIPQNLSPYQPGCMTSSGETATAAGRNISDRHLEHLRRLRGEQLYRVQPALGAVGRSLCRRAADIRHPAQ